MKNKLIKTALILGSLLIILINIPILFENKITQKIKWAATDAVHAKVDFEKIKLSLFRSFPQLNIELKNLSLTGTDDFDNSKLLTSDQLSISVNISSLWSNDGLIISSIKLKHPSINILVNKFGKSSWDISKTKTSPGAGTASDKKRSIINLEKIEISDASLSYQNESSPLSFALLNGNFELSGAFNGNSSKLRISGQADSLNLDSNGSRYISNMKIAIKGNLQSDFDKKTFKILQNELLINKLPIELQGVFSFAEKASLFDLTFKSPTSSLGDLLGFIPEKYQKNLKGIETNGAITFGGFVKGTYSGDSLPAFNVDLKIAGGRLKYPKLPKEIGQIEINANISKPQGVLDLTRVDIGKADASLAGNQVKAALSISTPVSDPQLQGSLKGVVDFALLRQAIPMDSIDLKGIVDASVEFDGRYSSIDKGDYENFKTDGKISFQNFVVASKSLPQNFEVKSANVSLNSKAISLTQLSGNFGESTFTAQGTITNYWSYLLRKSVLTGAITLNSSYFNFNQLMVKTNSGSKESGEAGKSSGIPENLNLTIQTSVTRALYDRLSITGITGKVIIKEQKVILEGLNMNMLQGKVLISGTYSTPKGAVPDFDIKLDIKDVDLPTAYQSSGTIRHFLPIAGQSTGAFNSSISFTGRIGPDDTPVFTSINGGGTLTGKNIELVGADFFNEIAKYFRKDLFKRVKISDFTTNFKMVNGGLTVAPFSTRLAGQDVTISGKQSANLILDYKLDFKVNKEDLSQDVNTYIGFVPGAENIKKYPIEINLGGSFDKPDVKVDLTEAKDLVAKEFTKKAGSAIQDALKKFGLDKLFK